MGAHSEASARSVARGDYRLGFIGQSRARSYGESKNHFRENIAYNTLPYNFTRMLLLPLEELSTLLGAILPCRRRSAHEELAMEHCVQRYGISHWLESPAAQSGRKCLEDRFARIVAKLPHPPGDREGEFRLITFVMFVHELICKTSNPSFVKTKL